MSKELEAQEPKHYLKAIKVLQDSFSFSSYNPDGDYAVISFNIKTKEERDLINDVLFSGCKIV